MTDDGVQQAGPPTTLSLPGSEGYDVVVGHGVLDRLPALCAEHKKAAEKLPSYAKFMTRTGERRKGGLTLVGD
jgi:hypothetical protein